MTGKEALKNIADKTALNKCNYKEFFDIIEKDLNRLEKLERYLVKWEEQLGIDGVNSKGMVRADIQFLLKED